MDAKQPPEWILEMPGGSHSGPYTLEQVRGFLASGEITQSTRVASKDLPGRWMSVQELLRSHHAKTTDVAESLFDTLQAAKDRKAAKQALPPSASAASAPENRSVAKRLAIALAALAVAGAGAWIIVSHLSEKQESAESGFSNPITSTAPGPIHTHPATAAAAANAAQQTAPPPKPIQPGGFAGMSLKGTMPIRRAERGLAPAPAPAAPPPIPSRNYGSSDDYDRRDDRRDDRYSDERERQVDREDRYRDEREQDTADAEGTREVPPPPPPAIQTPYPQSSQSYDEQQDPQQAPDERQSDASAQQVPPPPPPLPVDQ